MMKLSILDAIQKPRGKRSADALASSVELAGRRVSWLSGGVTRSAPLD